MSGANGSGKTTLIRTLATLVRVDGGSGTLLGVDITGDAIYDVRNRIGLIGHIPSVIAELTLQENVEHSARLIGIGTDRAARLLDVVGLGSVRSTPASKSSFGMKRRAEVAGVLLRRPRLLLLDEAMSGLDTEASGLIDALIERTTGDGGAVLMVSHDPSHLSPRAHTGYRLLDGALAPA